MTSRHVDAVLFVDSLGSGGAQRQIVELACGLHARGKAVRVVIYHPLMHHAARLNEKGVPVDIIRKRGPFDPLFLLRLWLHFRRCRPRVLISFLNMPGLWGRTIGRLAGVETIINSTRGTAIGDSRLWMLIERVCGPLSSATVVNASETKSILVSGAGRRPERIFIIPNGFDASRFPERPDKAVTRGIRTRLGISDTQHFLLMVGRIHLLKNHACMLKAIAALEPKLRKKLKVVIAGKVVDAGLLSILKKDILSLQIDGQVQFAGEVKGVDAWYPAADSTALTSIKEGLPNTVIESMLAGRVTVAPRISDLGNIIDHGETGFLFEPNDYRGLADLLKLVIEMQPQRRADIGLRARAVALERYCADTMVDSFEQLCFSPGRASGVDFSTNG